MILNMEYNVSLILDGQTSNGSNTGQHTDTQYVSHLNILLRLERRRERVEEEEMMVVTQQGASEGSVMENHRSLQRISEKNYSRQRH